MNYKKNTKIAVLITVVLAVAITGSAFAFGVGWSGFNLRKQSNYTIQFPYQKFSDISAKDMKALILNEINKPNGNIHLFNPQIIALNTDYTIKQFISEFIILENKDGVIDYKVYQISISPEKKIMRIRPMSYTEFFNDEYRKCTFTDFWNALSMLPEDATNETIIKKSPDYYSFKYEPYDRYNNSSINLKYIFYDSNGVIKSYRESPWVMFTFIPMYQDENDPNSTDGIGTTILYYYHQQIAPQIVLHEYDGNPDLALGEALTKEETGWVRLTGKVFIEVKVPDGAMTVQTYYAETGTEVTAHRMLDSKYSAPYKNPSVPTNDYLTGNSFNVADYYPDGFLGHIWAVITDTDGVEHSSGIINVIYEPDTLAAHDEVTNDLEIARAVISVTVDNSLNWNNMYPRIYTSGKKINAVLDYIDNLTLKDEFPENPNEYAGSTSSITILFDDGTKSVYYHFGNMFFGKATENGIDWKRMEYEEAAEFDTIIQNNPSD